MSDQSAELEKTKGVSNVSLRRQWDKDEYRKKAFEREENSRGPAVKRKFEKDENGVLISVPLLSGRSEKGVTRTIEQDVGKSRMVNPEGKGAERGGYWCEHCQRSYMDSNAYLEHLNSRMHQAAIGNSMNVKKSTKEEVTSRLRMHIQKKLNAVQKGEEGDEGEKYDFKARVAKLEKEEQERKERRQEAKRRKKQEKEKEKIEAQNAFDDQEAMAMMGFGSFGGKK